jgi:hypothetical protein
MERVLQATAPTVYGRFYVDGVGTDPTPDTATVEITRADGTVLVASTAATNVAGLGNEGLFSFPLTTTHTALLDRLTVRWTSNLGTVTTYVEVAGGFLFSTAEALADSELDGKDAADIAAARTKAERKLEQLCGVAFVPRYERERITGSVRVNAWNLQLKWSNVRSIRSASVAGTALTAAELLTVVPNGGWLYYPAGWATGAWGAVGDITVSYEHGLDSPPPDGDRACLRLAKHYLTDWTADDRALRLDTEAGSYVMAVAGRGGSHVGIPEVDEFINDNRALRVV